MASRVSFSTSNPSCPAKRTPRSIRRASSEKRCLASPTQRMTFFSRSEMPPNRSIIPLFGLYAIALIVKSRRFKSSSRFAVYSTCLGCRWSSYSPSTRYVVTSYPVPSTITVTVPCAIPVSMVLRKICFTSSGFADVVISQSFGTCPSTLSLTHPPTTYPSFPFSSSLSRIHCTCSGICMPSSLFLNLLMSEDESSFLWFLYASTDPSWRIPYGLRKNSRFHTRLWKRWPGSDDRADTMAVVLRISGICQKYCVVCFIV